MGFFSFTQEIAIDLGTANTIIIHDDKIVVDEPSVVALEKKTEKLVAVGEKARQMHEKTAPHITTIRPLRRCYCRLLRCRTDDSWYGENGKSSTSPVYSLVAYGSVYPFGQYRGGDSCRA